MPLPRLIVYVVVLATWQLHPQAVAAAGPAITAASDSSAACNTGSSRLLLANLARLPAQCRPGHSPVAAAVFECFASSRVVVHKCRLLMLPGKPVSREGLDCKVLHAQGSLTGPSNATLTGVLDSSKVASMLQQQPQPAFVSGLDSAKLQQQLQQGLAMLFADVAVSRTGNASTGNTTAAAQQAHQQHALPRSPGGQAAQQDRRTGGNATTTGQRPGEQQREQQRQRQQRRRRRPRSHQHGANSTAASEHAGEVAHADAPNTGTSATAALEPAPLNTAVNSTSNNVSTGVSSSSGSRAGPHTAASTPESAGGSTGQLNGMHSAPATPATAPKRAVDPTSPAAAHSSEGRRLQQYSHSAATGAGAWGLHALMAPPAHQLRLLLASAPAAAPAAPTPAQQVGGGPLNSPAGTAAAATAAAPHGAVLFRQGNSIVLQASSTCQYQFLVTRNFGLLSGSPSSAQALELPRRAASGGGRGRAWWLSAAALFAGVSAVLALAVCFMSAQLWARYRSYQVLPSGPTAGDAEHQPAAASTSTDAERTSTRPAPSWRDDMLQSQAVTVELPTISKSGPILAADRAAYQDQQQL